MMHVSNPIRQHTEEVRSTPLLREKMSTGTAPQRKQLSPGAALQRQFLGSATRPGQLTTEEPRKNDSAPHNAGPTPLSTPPTDANGSLRRSTFCSPIAPPCMAGLPSFSTQRRPHGPAQSESRGRAAPYAVAYRAVTASLPTEGMPHPVKCAPIPKTVCRGRADAVGRSHSSR